MGISHWVGLYHVFQGGCPPPGDYVDDTNPQSYALYGCPSTSYTCSQDLPDPIFNYMGYVDDRCMNEFTPGQGVRLADEISTYRNL